MARKIIRAPDLPPSQPEFVAKNSMNRQGQHGHPTMVARRHATRPRAQAFVRRLRYCTPLS